MVLNAILEWQNTDSTREMNSRLESLFTRGIFTEGLIVPVTGSLEIDVQPFTAMSNDGMLVTNDEAERLAIPLDQTNFIVLLARHVIGGAPELEYKVLEASVFNALIDKDDHIVFGTVTTASPATEVAATDISYAQRDEQDRRGRSAFRGKLGSTSELPLDPAFRKAGDFYIISDGLGTPPEIHAWDGLAWVNITATAAIASDLAMHRANMFSDEIHLTDDQADAALGSAGAPAIGNRYVTEVDPRLPTQDENDALVGSDGSPSSTNKYITQEYPVAAPTRLGFPVAPGGVVTVALANGPFFVGNGAIGSANRFFSFLDFTLERGYLNSAGAAVQVTGVFKDIFLTIPLDPSVDADADGFFSGDIFLGLNFAIDTSVRLLYGKRETLGSILRNFAIVATPGNEVTSSTVVNRISNIKGRDFDDPTPTEEQNINLRLDLNSISAYLGSVLETNVVAAAEDFDRLKDDPILGSFFVKNIGIDDVFTYLNVTLETLSYDPTTGKVTYGGPISLAPVRIGDRFVDGGGSEFRVVAIDDSLDTVDIVSLETGEIPPTINTSVGSANDGAIKINFNPRELLLSEMKLNYGAEVIHAREIFRNGTEFSKPDGLVSYGIKDTDGRLNPRIAFFGGWQNFTNPAGEQFITNDGNNGKIVVTGFFTDLILLMRRKNDSPSLSISIDDTPPTVLSTSASGTFASSVGTSEGPKFHQLPLATGLPNDRPNTISAGIVGATTETLDIFGFVFVRSNSVSDGLLESGRAFENASIIQRDTLTTSTTIPQLGSLVRGGRVLLSIDDNTHSTALKALLDIDEGSTPSGTATGASISVTAGTGKLKDYRVGDLIQVFSATVAEIRQILSITGTTIALTSATSFAGDAIVIRHICSTDLTIPNPGEEEEVVEYDILTDFVNRTSTDFTSADIKDRFVVSQDGQTIISGEDLSITETGLAGADAAVRLESSGTLRITTTCTRLDLLAVNDAAATCSISIDGSPTVSYSFAGSAARRHTIFFNSRYQTHEVVITPSAGNLLFTKLFLFGPAKPTLVGFPNVVADIQQIARYDRSEVSDLLTVAPNVYVNGGLFHEAQTYLSYIDGTGANPDWSVTEDFSKSTYGRYTITENEDASIEFYFLGDSFELQYITGPDHGIFEVAVDGTALQSVGGTIVGDYTGNEVDAYSATYGRKNIGVYGITFGLHRVTAAIQNPRAKNGASSGFLMAFTGFYVTNDSGYLSSGFDREGSYSGVVDTRNFVPLEIAPSVQQVAEEQTRSAKISLGSGTTSIVVTLSDPLPDINYAVVATFINTVDGSPTFQPITITSQTTSGFTASWNSPLPTANYSLSYFVTTF